MIKVRNKKIIHRLANSSFRAAKTRNVIAVIAIALTCILFTSLFTMGAGAVESMQRATMIMSGGNGHAAVKRVTDEQYNAISTHPLIKEIAYCRMLSDSVDNAPLIKRYTEFWYFDDLGMKFNFSEPTEGHRPLAENEVIVDTKTLEMLDIPLEIGAHIILELTIHGQRVVRDFVLAGWWESDPGFNVGQIIASREYVDAHINELYNSYYEDISLTGAITGYIKFESSLSLDQKLETVLTESGFSMDEASHNYVATGINWAYMSTNIGMDAGTITAMACFLMLFMFAGYLIIYNIFQISVLRDIRFYGLLKTVGATGRQLRAIIRHQAFLLSGIGIPIGLFAGFFVGKKFVPMLIARSIYAGSTVIVSPNLLIFAGAALFALFTVLISTRRPGAMAAKVSPVQAVIYTDNDINKRNKLKMSKDGGRPKNMAVANICRNKKRTVLVILSMTLSIVLTNTVFTLSQSVDVDKALIRFNDSDFLIGHVDLINLKYRGEDSALSESFISAVESLDGFEEGGRLYGSWASYTSKTSKQTMNKWSDGSFGTSVYGLDDFPFSRLQLLDGDIDEEKLATGNYVLEGVRMDDHGNAEMDSFNHSVGDKVKLSIGDSIHEMTVLGHVVANQNSNTDGTWGGSGFFIPGDVYKTLTGVTHVMSYAFNMAEHKEEETERFLKQYTDIIEPAMNYKSKFTALAGLEGLRDTALLIGGSLSVIIGLIGVLNYINAILTSILTRQKEFAVLQSIGMTRRQLVTMLCWEGEYYSVLTAASSVMLSIVSSLFIIRPLGSQIWFMSYHFVYWPLVIIIPMLAVLGIFVPYITYCASDRQSIVERLRIII